ncbi:SGNH/GDSL hydrolase family protein [Arthrobacter pityocampae]|nr:SGNH/GDSL hydrolase family protein [Arthrobacter pityocampae]
MEIEGCVVFAGDSVTDCGWREDPDHLGSGYVRELASGEALARCRVLNAGTGGDRLEDLERRWEEDVLAARPDVVSVMIGINDTWRRFDSGLPSDLGAFTDRYRSLLGSLAPDVGIVLLEPFVIPVDEGQMRWREDLDPRIDAVHLLAEEFGAALVPLDGILNELARRTGAAVLADDGVHPTALGHQEIAGAWRRAVSTA